MKQKCKCTTYILHDVYTHGGPPLRFLGQTSLARDHLKQCNQWSLNEMMSQAFYYFHITTTAQNVYPRRLNSQDIFVLKGFKGIL